MGNERIDAIVKNPSSGKSAQTAFKLLLVAGGMFAFGFALVPLYNIVCDLTGLNGKTSDEVYLAKEVPAAGDRQVTVQFLASSNAELPWEFRPARRTLKVALGETNATTFYARNPGRETMTAQAVPSVTPSRAARYFHKTECFCFEQQQLGGGEGRDMPLRFILDNDLPADISTVTLSYTLYDVTEQIDIVQRGDIPLPVSHGAGDERMPARL